MRQDIIYQQAQEEEISRNEKVARELRAKIKWNTQRKCGNP